MVTHQGIVVTDHIVMVRQIGREMKELTRPAIVMTDRIGAVLSMNRAVAPVLAATVTDRMEASRKTRRVVVRIQTEIAMVAGIHLGRAGAEQQSSSDHNHHCPIVRRSRRDPQRWTNRH